MNHDTGCTEWNRFTAPAAIECVCGDAFKQLRVDLEQAQSALTAVLAHIEALPENMQRDCYWAPLFAQLRTPATGKEEA